MNMDDLSKAFCDNITVAYNEEFFTFAIHSGEHVTAYGTTPQHMKRLMLMLNARIKDYESEYGEIKTEWPLNVVSPIQPVDLTNPKQEKKKKKSGE
jgi:hypothetical protein